ncbi:hypothetical protein KIN20_020677 [Parelaphostrongylus tenuis]|uniref:Uncharacterized protein n=1 Tax=Parelaphostrongylus tenuis TaxID=148309 RepID=A0AAD5N3G4_PARTN|nr:hypothetical protein KIN20_020677 [Parelaphostrongylus tenuis]
MISLVDYGSDSGDEADELPTEVKPSVSTASTKATLDFSSTNGDQESNFESYDVLEGSSPFSLPSVVESTTSASNFSIEADLEEIVKPKDWEIRLGEKERRRRDKKAKKKAKKLKRKEREGSSVEVVPNEQKRIHKGYRFRVHYLFVASWCV